jgi:hypothetical protein
MEEGIMDQVQRVQHLLSDLYPMFTVSAIEDIAAVCGVSYKVIAVFINLKRLEYKSIRNEVIDFVKRHRPDIDLQQPIWIPEDDLYAKVDDGWMRKFLALY